MNKANTEYLIKKYPSLYKYYNKGIKTSAMCWGFDCGDGWFDLIDMLSFFITRIDPNVTALQVKEKWGMLAFYVGPTEDRVFDLIDRYVAASKHVCEICGKDGKLRCRNGWYMTRCEECFEKDIHSESR